MLPVLSLEPIPCSQVNILKNQRSPPPKKNNKPQVKVPGHWIIYVARMRKGKARNYANELVDQVNQ